jgi:hypothetical protein
MTDVYDIAGGIPQPVVTEVKQAMERASDGRPQELLLGECPYNAVRLWSELQEAGQQVNTITGGVTYPNQPQPEDIEQAMELGAVHWWVEGEVEGHAVVLDLAAEVPEEMGKRLIRVETPERYIPMEEGPSRSAIETFQTR